MTTLSNLHYSVNLLFHNFFFHTTILKCKGINLEYIHNWVWRRLQKFYLKVNTSDTVFCFYTFINKLNIATS